VVSPGVYGAVLAPRTWGMRLGSDLKDTASRG
jgi:hypothetical protein